jgi:hypothetical protein
LSPIHSLGSGISTAYVHDNKPPDRLTLNCVLLC